MTRRLTARLAVAAAIALSAAVAAPATAKPLCLQIVDPSGDAGPGGGAAAPLNRDSLDILSGDVATGRRNLVAALRLKSVQPDAVLAAGAQFTVTFVADGVENVLAYRTYATGEKVATHSVGTSASAPTTAVDVVVDAGTATITWTVPRRAVPALKKPGAKLSALAGTSAIGTNARAVGDFSASHGADRAESAKTYTDLAPTCLKGT